MVIIKILIVEDEPSLLKIIAKRLKEEGYSVDMCKDGEEGQYLLEVTEYDCIVLDIMLPIIDGLTLLKGVRTKGVLTPVLLLTAKDSIEDRVKGLDSGADDYLVKPFSFDELLARIRALLRRNVDTRDDTLCISDLTLDIRTHIVKRNEKLIELTAKEYSVLEYLMKNKERIVTRTQIAEHVWNYDFDYNSNIVDVYIRYLRGKIDEGFDNKLIHTVRGSGYVLKEKT
ncbi:MAG: response regulator [Caulobacteraceae bacterium]